MKIAGVLFLVAAAAAADDGSWGGERDSTASQGALYSVSGTVPVVMEKEYLELSDLKTGSTRAVFQFRSTSTKDQVVECAFPITVTFDFRGGISFTSGGVVSGDVGTPLIDVGPGTDKRGLETGVGESAVEWFGLLGLKLSPWDPDSLVSDEPMDGSPYSGQYLRRDQYPVGIRTYPPEALVPKFWLAMTQDGAPVTVTSAVVDFGKEPGRIVLHFRHQMKLAAGATSRLEVRYAWPTLASQAEEGGVRFPRATETYTWNYILETASSWQGRLSTLVLAVPLGTELPRHWLPLGVRNGRMLYLWKDAKPSASDNLELSWTESARDYHSLWSNPDSAIPPDPFRENQTLRFIGASSAIKDRATAFLEDGVMNAPFTGDRLFDGYRETAWAVNTPQGGVGETVSFFLKGPAGVVAIQNGYLRSISNYAPKSTASFYAKNSRVKTLSFIGPGGTTTLDLTDVRDQMQYFNVALAPGPYQVRIDAIYPGSQYKDTCLGELTFLPGSAATLHALADDPFFASSW